MLRLAQPGCHQAGDIGYAPHEVPVVGIRGSCSNPNEDGITLDVRFADLLELENIGRAVLLVCDRLHSFLLLCVGWRWPLPVYTVHLGANCRCTAYTCQGKEEWLSRSRLRAGPS